MRVWFSVGGVDRIEVVLLGSLDGTWHFDPYDCLSECIN